MQGLNGLSAIAGFQVQIDEDSQATPEQRLGGPADPRHATVGEQARPYPWEANSTQAASMHGPYGPENQLLDDAEYWYLTPAGDESQDPYMDRTPSRRAGPFPKGIASGPVPSSGPDDIAYQLAQSAAIHAIDTNASAKLATSSQGDVQQDEWNELLETNPGHSDLQPIPKQMMSSGFMFGTRDRTQSMARQNEYGYDSSHMHRRYASGPIPGNTLWMRPGGRPMAKTLPGPARPPIGPDSPFAGQDLGVSFGIDGAYLQNIPSEYEAPPTPQLAPAAVSAVNNSVVEWY